MSVLALDYQARRRPSVELERGVGEEEGGGYPGPGCACPCPDLAVSGKEGEHDGRSALFRHVGTEKYPKGAGEL